MITLDDPARHLISFDHNTFHRLFTGSEPPKEGGSIQKKSHAKKSPVQNTTEPNVPESKDSGHVRDSTLAHDATQKNSEQTVQPEPVRNSDVQANLTNSQSSEIETELESMDDSLLHVVNSGWQGLDIPKFISNKYAQDPFFKHIFASPKDYHNFEVENDLIYLKQNHGRVLCIPRVDYYGRNLREIIISREAHSILAHLGLKKTLDYLRDYVWWK
ncbi:hypothetical protein K438DRAFT_1629645, partial [Mycena galopus ATCC 62051]